MFDLPKTDILFADSNRGIYIPQHFAESVVRECVEGVTEADWGDLEMGPEHPFYWYAWYEVLDNAIATDPDSGIVYRLYQDGYLWLVPIDWEPEED